MLLDRGANIEARNARGATPLITASARGNLALVLLLLNQGRKLRHATGTATPRCTKPACRVIYPASTRTSTRACRHPSVTSSDLRRFTKRSDGSGKRPANRVQTDWRDNVRLSTGCCVPEPTLRCGTAAEERRWCWPWKATMPRYNRCSIRHPFTTHRLPSLPRVPRSLKKQKIPINCS